MTKCKRLSIVGVIMGLVALLVSSVFLPALPAYGQESTIKIGYVSILTGPDSTTGVPVSYGFMDRVRWENEQGGINGTKLELMLEDMRGDFSHVMSGCKKFTAAGAVLEFSFVACGLTLELPLLIKAGRPVAYVGAGITKDLTSKPEQFIFSSSPSYVSEVLAYIDEIREITGIKDRPLKVGILCYTEVSGQHVVNDAPYIPSEYNIEYVGCELVPVMGVVDTSAEVLRLLKKKPDVLYLSSGGSIAVAFLKDTQRLGVQEKGIMIISNYATADPCILDVTWPAGKGVYGTVVFPVGCDSEQQPRMDDLLHAAKEWRGWERGKIANVYCVGWLTADVGIEGIRRAVEKVGVENLKPMDVRDALASMKDYDSGLVPYLISMTDEKPWYGDKSHLYRVVGKEEYEFIGGWKDITWAPPYYKMENRVISSG
jgi:hypothetical protein